MLQAVARSVSLRGTAAAALGAAHQTRSIINHRGAARHYASTSCYAVSCGNGDYGRLGHRSGEGGSEPLGSERFLPLAGLDGVNVRAVAAGGSHTVVLSGA